MKVFNYIISVFHRFGNVKINSKCNNRKAFKCTFNSIYCLSLENATKYIVQKMFNETTVHISKKYNSTT